MKMLYDHLEVSIVIYIGLQLGFLPATNTHTVPTVFDKTEYRSMFHAFRNYVFRSVGKTSLRPGGWMMQQPYLDNEPFPCGMNNSRSSKTAGSVHELRPGDIDVIAAMGDSLTAASGAAANSFLDLFMENRGLAWSIGGQYTWRNVTTLPNILRVFNPKLVGYSLNDAFPFHYDTQFNVAEIGAVSADLPFMAKALVERIKRDPRVNFKKSWKMLTICMGGNDFCTFICTMKNPESLPEIHRENLLEALRYIRDNLPRYCFHAHALGTVFFRSHSLTGREDYLPQRNGTPLELPNTYGWTFVNVVTEPAPHKVVTMKTNSRFCRMINHLECSCFVGNLFKPTEETLERYRQIHEKFSLVEEEVSKAKEFRGLREFAVVFQPLTRNLSMETEEAKVDYSLLAYDCFHMSQKGNAWAGTTLWNSLFQREGEKDENWSSPHKKFLCPTKENPYILTYDNMYPRRG